MGMFYFVRTGKNQFSYFYGRREETASSYSHVQGIELHFALLLSLYGTRLP